jgi:hypothetical protein
MSREVIQDHPDLLGLRVVFLNQVPHWMQLAGLEWYSN